MKKTSVVFAAFLCVIGVGVFSISQWESLHLTYEKSAQPEGYQTPGQHDRVSPKATYRLKREGRVTKLEIAPNVPKYFGDNLEMVAFAPGSGWLKFRTDDGITPTLQFKRVTLGEIQRFNAFSKSINSPIRVALSGNVLHVTAEETAEDLAFFRGKGESAEDNRPLSAYNQTFDQSDSAPKVVMKKDADGNLFLVKLEDKGKGADPIAAKE